MPVQIATRRQHKKQGRAAPAAARNSCPACPTPVAVLVAKQDRHSISHLTGKPPVLQMQKQGLLAAATIVAAASNPCFCICSTGGFPVRWLIEWRSCLATRTATGVGHAGQELRAAAGAARPCFLCCRRVAI